MKVQKKLVINLLKPKSSNNGGSMSKQLSFAQTAMGKKVIMAVTGIILLGFVLVHMLGNLQIHLELMNPGAGKAALNKYAAFLHSMPLMVWGTRIVLLLSVLLHFWAAISLIKQNGSARPVSYQRHATQATTYAAKTMKIGGITLLLFIIYHLGHLTAGTFAPVGTYTAPTAEAVNVFDNVVRGFQIPWLSGFYIIAQVFLGMHLYHGVWSLTQTLGLSHNRFNCLRRQAAIVFATLVAVGNISIPVAVLAGLIK
jgi:succinate dehydrogenase / fumarate reductase cytochrome b subunit